MNHIPRLHAISTGRQSAAELIQIVEAIYPYVDTIHLREKSKSARELQEIIMELEQRGVPLKKLMVNDRVDLAYSLGVKGVQLAYHSISPELVRSSFPTLLIGRSIHSLEEAKEAQLGGSDYVLYGHVYPSQSKPGQIHRGIKQLKKIVNGVHVPVIAIGGINHSNIKDVMSAGVHGAAIMSGIFMAENPADSAKKYHRLLHSGGGISD